MSYVNTILWSKEIVSKVRNFNNVIVNFNLLYKDMVKQSINEQENIFGRSFTSLRTNYKIIYMNNYFICVDLLLRLISNVANFIDKCKRKWKCKWIFFIEHCEEYTPPWRKIYMSKSAKYPANENFAYNITGKYMSALMPMLTDEEIEIYAPFERFLSKRYPYIFKNTIHSRNVIYDYDRRYKRLCKNRFFHHMQVLQTVPTENEWKMIYNFLIYTISKWRGVNVLKEKGALIDGYGESELAAFFSTRLHKSSLVMSRKMIRCKDVYIYNARNKNIYCTVKSRCDSDSFENIPFMCIHNYSKNKYSLDKLFDVCASEMENSLLSIDVYNAYNIFISPKKLYIKKQRPKEYEDFPISYTNIPLDKSMALEILIPFINKYNALFNTRIK